MPPGDHSSLTGHRRRLQRVLTEDYDLNRSLVGEGTSPSLGCLQLRYRKNRK